MALVMAYGAAVGAVAGSKLVTKLSPGSVAKYRVSSNVTEYAGTSAKVTSAYANQMPISVNCLSKQGRGVRLSVTSGPLFARGRSVGRARVYEASLDGGVDQRPPALLWVLIPRSGVSVGQTWSASLNGPTPLPAGLRATYKYVGVSGRLARIAMTVAGKAACTVRGSGTLYVRLSDGVLESGQATFNIAYERAENNAARRITVNSHVLLRCTVGK